LRIKIRLWIEEGDKHIIGSGVANLLSYIDDFGSIRAAAKKMKMSYRRAWGSIRKLESNVGFNVINRSIGGSRGGGSALTFKGRLLLQRYLALSRSIKAFSDKRLKALFLKTDPFLDSVSENPLETSTSAKL